jgi:hypothetical protein
MKRIKITLLIFLILLGVNLKLAQANDQFSFDYDVTYKIEKSGDANVSQKVTITNKQNDVIATDYSLTLNLQDIFDIKVTSGKDTLDYEMQKIEDETTIKVNLDNQQIGEGRKNTVVIDFKTQDLVSKSGNIWTVRTPPISNLDLVENYNVSLQVPKAFGPKIVVSPSTQDQPDTTDYYIFNFTKDQIKGRGISGNFGSYQTLDFNLKYHLKNDSFFLQLKPLPFLLKLKDTNKFLIKT